jgi:D-alanine transaminase
MAGLPGIAWVNGKITSLEEAQVPFLDRGYFFGDGVYEAIKVTNGKIFALAEHLERFERSMKEIRIPAPKSKEEFTAIIRECVEKAGIPNAFVYLQVTRGVGPRMHAFLPKAEPMVTLFVSPMAPIEESIREAGVTVITVPDERWAHPHIKTLNLLPNVLAKQAAEEKGAYEAILVLGDTPGEGLVTEAASSNVLAVVDGVVVTPPTNGRILPGVTRAILLEVARAGGIEVVERDLTLKELRKAEEIMVTNTAAEILGVRELDGVPVGKGKPGPVTQKLFELFMASSFKRFF